MNSERSLSIDATTSAHTFCGDFAFRSGNTVYHCCSIRRTWRERLFSLPWQPWEATIPLIEITPVPSVTTVLHLD